MGQEVCDQGLRWIFRDDGREFRWRDSHRNPRHISLASTGRVATRILSHHLQKIHPSPCSQTSWIPHLSRDMEVVVQGFGHSSNHMTTCPCIVSILGQVALTWANGSDTWFDSVFHPSAPMKPLPCVRKSSIPREVDNSQRDGARPRDARTPDKGGEDAHCAGDESVSPTGWTHDPPHS